MLTRAFGWVQADVPTPPAEEESQFQQITAARKYIAEQALKQQAKKVSCQADLPKQQPCGTCLLGILYHVICCIAGSHV